MRKTVFTTALTVASASAAQEIGTRTTIGTTQVGWLAPRAWTTATINWDTTDFGGTIDKTHRVYVVLDPDDQIHETYETESGPDPAGGYSTPYGNRTYCVTSDLTGGVQRCIDPGQNNEGWRPVKVLPQVMGDPSFDRPGKLSFRSDAVAALDRRGTLVTGNVQAYAGQPLRIRVRIDTDQANRQYNHLLLWDGDPNAGGTLITDKQAYTGNPLGNYIWVDWLATRPLGQHRLYAQVLANDADGHQLTVTSDMLKVEVIPAPKGRW